MTSKTLTYDNHSRHFKDCKYVYPVVSRRSQGVSLGINLNPNNACNWRCVYCQVEGLIRGKPDRIDLAQLEHELDVMLEWIVHGDFLAEYTTPELRRFNDICLAGNGEPTLSKDFVAVAEIIGKLRTEYAIGNEVKTILITNGSEMHQPDVQKGIALLAANNGEVWFKIDRANPDSIKQVNQVALHLEGIIERLDIVSKISPTYIQTCWFKTANIAPDAAEVTAYVELIGQLKDKIRGVLLYTTARNPALPEGQNISPVGEEYLAAMTARIEQLGINVKYYP